MKKRILAALVLLAMIIGLCGTLASAAETPKYQVGYAKVDINPYYSAAYEAVLQANYPDYDPASLGLAYGDIMPVPLRGNSHEAERLAIGKQDDNGDGLVDEDDGIFATCIAITDPSGETVILMSMDLIGVSAACAAAVRQGIHETYPEITGDRVMINGSHSHHGVSVAALTALKNSNDPDDVASYWLHKEWVTQLNNLLVQAAKDALADQKPATMSKGTIEAEEALCSQTAVGDTLNALRAQNKEEDPEKYAYVEYVTVLEPAANADSVTDWTDTDGIRHVAVPEVFPERAYNGVRHYQQIVQDATRTEAWKNEGTFYAYNFPKYDDSNIASAPEGFESGDYIPAGNQFVYVGGDNFNGVSEVGKGSAAGTYWITKVEGSTTPTADQYVSDEVETRAVELSDVFDGGSEIGEIGIEVPFIKGTSTRVYKFPDMKVVTEVDHVSEVDDTMLILQFTFDDASIAPVLLINWRAHTNQNRQSSLDYMAHYTDFGFYDSFFQVSSDWINAFRYTLEQAGYRVAYFNGAAGNVNAASRLSAESGWLDWSEGTAKATYYAEADVGTTDAYGNEVTEDMVGLCIEAYNGKADVLEGVILTDSSIAKNRGAIYGSELAEVALELLSGENSTYKMTEITNPTGGIRTQQTVRQTERRTVSVFEYLAGCKYHDEDLKDGISNNKSGAVAYAITYWLDANGEPLIDTANNRSMVDDTTGVSITGTDGSYLYTDSDGDPVQGVEKKTGSFTIASYLHANDAISVYESTATAGTKVELNAIMLCDQIAIITAPGELYDRYSSTAAWSAETGVTGMDSNAWETLWDEDTYGEPFFLGYCNGSTGYMPSQVTYDYSTGVTGKAQGSYETQTTNFAQGTGEDIMVEFDWLLDNVNGESTETSEAYCRHCQEDVLWLPLSAWKEHSASLTTGHYYVDADSAIDAASITASTVVCLDLWGKTLTGSERAFVVDSGAVLNIQDSVGGGSVVGQGFAGTAFHGGTFYVQDGAELNLYSGEMKFALKDGYTKPNNGGVVYNLGTFNMYGGTITGGDCGNAGGSIYSTVSGSLNLYGGSIADGIADNVARTSCVMVKGTVTLAGNATMPKLCLWPGSADSYATMLTVQGAYTGTAVLDFYIGTGSDIQAGADIGTSDGAVLTGANLTVRGSELKPGVSGTDIRLFNQTAVYCEHCENTVLWTALSEYLTNTETLPTGHYYVDVDGYEMAAQTIAKGVAVCLDLRGNDLLGAERAFEIASGGTLNIQDSVGEGTLAGQGFETATAGVGTTNARGGSGGTINVASGGTLNLYSGKLTLTKTKIYSPSNGGVVNVDGVFNMHGGTVADGISAWAGGNIYVSYNTTAAFNMYGGTVTGGTGEYGDCVTARGYTLLAGSAGVDQLYLWPDSRETAVKLTEMLTIQGSYTGTTQLRISSPAADMDIGTSDGAVLTNANLTVRNSSLLVQVSGTDIVLAAPTVAQVVEILGGTVAAEYTDAQEAVNNCATGQKVLLLDAADTLSVSADNVTLDLNGQDIAKVTVAAGKTLACLDSANAAYQNNTCGKIATVELGDGSKIVGAEAARIREKTETEAALFSDVYLKVEESENTNVSFHAVGLTLKEVALRPGKAGIYYKSNFAGDSEVQKRVESYGVALSITGAPTAATMGTDSQYTSILNTEGQLFGINASATSTCLTNIMKTTQGNITNRRNAATPVYGRAYIKLTDGGGYLFGHPGSISLQQLVETIDAAVAAGDLALNETQQTEILAMYDTYYGAMKHWNLEYLPSVANS